MPFLVQGFFFQNQQSIGIAHRPIEGAVAVINERLAILMFAGAIWKDPKNSVEGLKGGMEDHFGHSNLSDIFMGENEFRFTKLYERRTDLINYTFVRHGNIWLGEYRGPNVGTGVSQCVTTEVPDDFFSPDLAMKFLGRSEACTWPW